MNIEFEKIEMQNFKSIGELVELNYQELQGLNFIYGKNLDVPNARNGSGKSSLVVDSLSFALFGRTLKGTNNQYIPNRIVGDKLKSYVKVYFKIDGQRYSSEVYGRIVAGRMSTIGMELLKLNADGSVDEDLTQSSVIKTKQYIQDNLLGCTFDIFKSSIILSSAEFMNFYEGMGKDAKRKYIENIFSLNCFGNMYNIIKADLNDIKKELTYSKNEVLKEASSITDLDKKFKEYNNQSIKNQEDIKNKILVKYNEIVDLKKKKEDFEKSSQNCSDIKKEILELKNKIESLDREKYSLEKKNIEANSEIKHLNKLMKDLDNIKNGLCDKCKLVMDERYDLSKNLESVSNLTSQLSENAEKISEITNNLVELKDKYSSLKETYEQNQKIIQNIEKLSLSIKYISSEIKNLKAEYDSNKENDKNPFEELLEKAKRTLKELKEKLILYNKNFKHLEILKDACSENGVKKFIIKDIVKLLNSLIQKYLNEIGAEMIVFFDETMDFKFLTQSGECEFSSFSAGEKQRIQISTMLAFRDLILNGKIHSNIFIIDEMLDSNVDTICIENVMKILKRKSVETHQNIFIISHRSELADNEGYWNNIIKVTKENGQSTYEII